MIVCSCNVLTAAQIVATLKTEAGSRPLSPGEAYRCLGCAPRCGRCLTTVRRLLAEAKVSDCNVGCAVCPGAHAHEPVPANDDAIAATGAAVATKVTASG